MIHYHPVATPPCRLWTQHPQPCWGPICWLLQAAPAWSGVSISPSCTLQILAKGKPPAQRKLFKSCCAPEALWAPQRWLQWEGQLWSSMEDDYRRTPLCSGSCIWMTDLNPLAEPTEVISPYLGQAKSGICLLLPLECTFPYSSIRLYEQTATHRGQYI